MTNRPCEVSIKSMAAVLDKLLRAAIGADSPWSVIEQGIAKFSEQPCHSLIELRQRNTKTIGTLFELFAKRYFVSNGYEAWLLAELPDELRTELKLDRQDVGIDLILRAPNGKWSAVQAKFRKPQGKATRRIPWKTLSTFLALATTSGPWDRLFVFTNAPGVTWHGKRPVNCTTIAARRLSSLDRAEVRAMSAPEGGCALTEEPSPNPSSEELRTARLLYFSGSQ